MRYAQVWTAAGGKRGVTAALLVGGTMLAAGCAVDWFEPTPSSPPGRADLAQLWVEPRDLEQRDLFYGVGGAKHAPDPAEVFRFDSQKKNMWASSPGYKVEDHRGRQWNVKLGAEARPEVLASRIIWAIGYHQPPVYYLAHWTLEQEDQRSTQDASRFRPGLKHLHRHGHWSWSANPFVETQAFRGLLVLMVLLNNWDLTIENTAIYDLDSRWEGARRWYVVRDVGASISRNRGSLLQGTRNDIEGFGRQGFVRSVDKGRVQFDWNGPHAELFENLSPADVHWTCALLSRLRPEQWDAALRAAGYGPEEAERLQARLAERIAEGVHLQ